MTIVALGALLFGAGSADLALADDVAGNLVCYNHPTGTLSFDRSPVTYGDSTVVHWDVSQPLQCQPNTRVRIIGYQVDGTTVSSGGGSMTVVPPQSGTWSLQIVNSFGSITLATADIAVNPVTLLSPGTHVDITSGDRSQRILLLRALATPNEDIHVVSSVEMDLTGLDGLQVASGVHLTGGHETTARGPRLFTRTYPRRLLVLDQSDNVRISGIRLDGGQGNESAGNNEEDSAGIASFAAIHLEIDHNDIYGWRGQGIEVRDNEADRITMDTASLVSIHDNYIHHNQHYTYLGGHGAGYGVELIYGATALIERNVFDYNRHSIAGDGRPGTGYFLRRNLILPNGGDEDPITSTHVIDMHGRDSCFLEASYSCGAAGEYMDIEYNSVLYYDDNDFKLRGTPSIRADVAHNVFGRGPDDALKQTHGDSIVAWDNRFGVTPLNQFGSCDFDRDGVADQFLATGANWWYNSSQLAHWVYLGDSTQLLPDVTLRDVNGDGHCDAFAFGVAYSGDGTGPIVNANPYGSPVAVARDGAGRLEVIGTNTYDNVYHARQGTTAVSPSLGNWEGFDGSMRSVAADTNADGRVEVFAVNGAGQIFNKWQWTSGADWSVGWNPFDGELNSIAVAHNRNGQLEVFGTNSVGAIVHRWRTDAGWSAWSLIDGQLHAIAAETNADGRIELVGVNFQGEIYHKVQTVADSNTWSNWQRLPGSLSSIAIARNQDGRLEIFGANASGIPVHSVETAKNTDTWEPWLTLSGLVSQVAAETNADGRIELFGVNAAGQVFHRWQRSPGIDWSGWVQLGGELRAVPPSLTVPDVRGMTQEAATAALSSAGLSIGRVVTTITHIVTEAGKIVTQTPGADTHAPPGTAVDVAVGRYPAVG